MEYTTMGRTAETSKINTHQVIYGGDGTDTAVTNHVNQLSREAKTQNEVHETQDYQNKTGTNTYPETQTKTYELDTGDKQAQ